MAWTYNPANVGTNDLDWIRLQIGDTDTNDQLLSDEEIAGVLTRESRRDIAAVSCADQIASKFGRFGSTEVPRAYGAIADRLRMRSRVATGPWSYSGNPASSSRDMVRFLIADIDVGDQQLSNAEIDAILAVETRPHFAAATCARTLSIHYALHRRAEKAQYYGALAASLELNKEIHAGTWSYSGDPHTSNVDMVRFLIGDVNPSMRLLNNAEITEVLQDEARVRYAAAICAESLAARFAGMDESGQPSVRYQRFVDLANKLREAEGGPDYL